MAPADRRAAAVLRLEPASPGPVPEVRVTRVASEPAIEPVPRAGRLVRGAGLARAFGAVAFLGVWAALAAFWEIAVARGWLNGRVLPPPSVLGAYVLAGNMSAGIGYGKVSYGQAILDTLGRVMAGFVIGLLGALVTAMLIWAFRPVRAVAMPLMQTIAPIAPVAWIPLAISLVGLGSGAAILVVVLAILGGVCASAVAAFDAIPGEYVKAGRLLGARGLRLWLRVVLPAAAPALVTLARMSFFGAWMAVLAGEMAGISSGLGALIMLGQQQFNMRLVMIGIVTIGALGFLIDRALLRLGRSLVWWEHRSARQVAR